ncbi:MAG TPA: hypothetical protein VGJ51_20035 [Candidatus Angelobacter sp.]
MDRRRRHQWPEGIQPSTAPAFKKLLKFAAVFVWMSMMMFVVYRGLRIHYDLWALQSKQVEAVSVGGHLFTDRSSIAQIVTALKASEWYSVNHGGWGDETTIVLKMVSGEEWEMRTGYHFTQNGAVVLRSSGPGGSGWQLGQVFSPALPNVLEQLGVPLSHCDTAHGHPCKSSQEPRH